MIGDYIEERNGGYYVAGTRISLDSVVYSFERGNSPEAIQREFPLLRLSQIYGAIAFYRTSRQPSAATSKPRSRPSKNPRFRSPKRIRNSGPSCSALANR